jgi:hypothetical protein
MTYLEQFRIDRLEERVATMERAAKEQLGSGMQPTWADYQGRVARQRPRRVWGREWLENYTDRLRY